MRWNQKVEPIKYLGEYVILALLAILRSRPYYGSDIKKYLLALIIVAAVVLVQLFTHLAYKKWHQAK